MTSSPKDDDVPDFSFLGSDSSDQPGGPPDFTGFAESPDTDAPDFSAFELSADVPSFEHLNDGPPEIPPDVPDVPDQATSALEADDSQLTPGEEGTSDSHPAAEEVSPAVAPVRLTRLTRPVARKKAASPEHRVSDPPPERPPQLPPDVPPLPVDDVEPDEVQQLAGEDSGESNEAPEDGFDVSQLRAALSGFGPPEAELPDDGPPDFSAFQFTEPQAELPAEADELTEDEGADPDPVEMEPDPGTDFQDVPDDPAGTEFEPELSDAMADDLTVDEFAPDAAEFESDDDLSEPDETPTAPAATAAASGAAAGAVAAGSANKTGDQTADDPVNSRSSRRKAPADTVSQKSFKLLAMYATALTLLLLVLFATGRISLSGRNNLESLPDIQPLRPGEFQRVPDGAALPDGHVLKLGESRRFGDIVLTPVRVTREPVSFTNALSRAAVRDEDTPPLLKLWFQIENVSDEMAFRPWDLALMTHRNPPFSTSEDTVSNTWLKVKQNDTDSETRVLNFFHSPDSPFDITDIGSTELLQPGQTQKTFVAASEHLNLIPADSIEGFRWRLLLRKGVRTDSGNGVTTLVDVMFTPADIGAAG
ncbi:MAG: hypothetical protein R3C49_24785 [Planctomycetaceae bacterium]